MCGLLSSEFKCFCCGRDKIICFQLFGEIVYDLDMVAIDVSRVAIDVFNSWLGRCLIDMTLFERGF